MDYEKAYKAVLKTATQWIKDGCTDKERICLESVFPELAESEDKRIIRAINNMLPFIPDEAYANNGVTKEGVLNWLEKHKEPIDPFDTKLFQDGVKEGRRLEREEIKKEQKSVEINEEDERIRKALIDEIKGWDEDYKLFKHVSKEQALAYLEKHKEQKPASSGSSEKPNNLLWSEEDEKIRKTLLDYYEEALDNYHCVEWLNGITYGELCDWLKSLRPQTHTVSIKDATKFGNLEYERGVKDGLNLHWKPSEEQMKNLLNAEGKMRELKFIAIASNLAKLYEQLKKLM